ncbi:uncharacterized protein LOC142106818 [Mixophyes fleayi]|uniref:uncharacterized protein LOC142106818 n=1 Tax=Mixophyes fleayi TaxID=3061075 RepID=UPI003F4D93FB
MKRNWSFVLEMAAGFYIRLTVLLPLLVHVPSTLSCGPNQYPELSDKKQFCCDFCAAGQQISDICTFHNAASKCTDCKDQYYNPKNARGYCKQCMTCYKDEGSIEISPCTKSSDAVCACPEGSTPKNERNTACRCDQGKEIVNNKCQPCRSGYFSTIENSVCRPWTDCSAKGETVVETGSATRDVKCTKPKNVTVDILPSAVTSTQTHSIQGRKATTLQSTRNNPPDIFNTEPTGNGSLSWGTLAFILIGSTLLSISAGIIITMIIQAIRKKRNRGFIRVQRCKLPVQEESTSSDTSLAKECPA